MQVNILVQQSNRRETIYTSYPGPVIEWAVGSKEESLEALVYNTPQHTVSGLVDTASGFTTGNRMVVGILLRAYNTCKGKGRCGGDAFPWGAGHGTLRDTRK